MIHIFDDQNLPWFLRLPQMLRLHLLRRTLHRALVRRRGLHTDALAIGSTTAGCPCHTSGLRGGSATQVHKCGVRIRPFFTTTVEKAAEETQTAEDRDRERIRAAVSEAPDFEALLAIVREETISPSGPQKLRFTVGNSLKWLKRLCALGDRAQLQGVPPPEVSLLLAHLKDLSEEGPDRLPHLVAHVVSTVSRLKYEGGGKEAVLDKVVEVYLRFLHELETGFADGGYDPGTAMKELIRARRKQIRQAAEEKLQAAEEQRRILKAEMMATREREKEEAREEARRGRCTSERINAAVSEAPDFEALLAIVREETMSPSGPQKLRFSIFNCVKWLNRLSELEDPALLQGVPAPEVSLLLAHVKDLMEEGTDRPLSSLVDIVLGVSPLRYEGGEKEAVLGTVVQRLLRGGLEGAGKRRLGTLEAGFAAAEYDPGPALTGLLRAAREANLWVREELARRRMEGATGAGGKEEGERKLMDEGWGRQEEGERRRTEMQEEGGHKGEGRGMRTGWVKDGESRQGKEGEGIGGKPEVLKKAEGEEARKEAETKEEQTDGKQVEVVDEQEQALLASLRSGGASAMVNALAALRSRRPKLGVIRRVLAALEEDGVEHMTPQDWQSLLDMLNWCQTGLGPGLVGHLCKQLVDTELEGWGANELAVLLRRLAFRQGDAEPVLLDMIAAKCALGLEGMDGTAVPQLVLGFARLDHPPGLPLLQQACQRVTPLLDSLTPSLLRHLLYGLVRLSYYPGEALAGHVVKACAESRFHGMTGVKLSDLVWSMAMCNHRADEAWLQGFYARAERLGWAAFSRQSLERTLWALVVIGGRVDEGLLRTVLNTMHSAADRAGEAGTVQKKEDLEALQRALGMYLYLHPEPGQLEEDLAAALQRLARLVPPPPLAPHSPSDTQLRLSERLRRRYELEEGVPVAMVSVDIMINLPGGRKVAVEQDGPMCYFANDSTRPTGETLLKRRVLDEATKRGTIDAWVVVRGYGKWDVEKIDEAVRAVQTEGCPPSV